MSFAFLAHPPSLSQLNTKPTKLNNTRSSILPPPKVVKPKESLDAIAISTSPPRRPSIRRRSATVSGTVCSITTWATSIVPGSPAPRTPRTPRTPPLSAIAESLRLRSASSPHVVTVQHGRRRSSASNSVSGFNFLNLLDTPSTAAYISVCTPSPSHLDNKPTAPSVGLDLQAQGYTTVFVRLPGTPVTPRTAPLQNSCVVPDPSLTEQFAKPPPVPAIPTTPKTPSSSSKKAFTRLRSLSFKSSKKTMFSQHHAASSSTTKRTPSMTASQKPKSSKKPSSSTPQARYGHLLAPAGGAGALPLSQEVQLSQMLDGGSVDANVRRVAKRHAKDTGAAVSSKKSKSREDAPGNGVTGVYRDGNGGLFWDEDEAFELAGLLKRSPSSPSTSPPNQSQHKRSALALGLLKAPTRSKTSPNESSTIPSDWIDPTRRGSESAASDASTTRSSSVASELGFVVRPLSGAGAGAAGGFVPGYRVGMGAAGPLRPGDAFSVPPDSRPGESMSPLESSKSAGRERPRARHRPAPLTLTSALPAPSAPPPAPAMKSAPARPRRMATAPPLPSSTGTRAREVEEGRKDFFASSFDPPAAPAPSKHDKEQHRPAPPPLSGSSLTTPTTGSKNGRRLSFNMGLGNMITSTARTVRRASASLGVPSPGPLTAVTGKFNNSSSVHINASAAASSTHLHSLAYGQTGGNGSTKSRASSSSSKTLAPAPPPLRSKTSKLKLSSLFHRDRSTKA